MESKFLFTSFSNIQCHVSPKFSSNENVYEQILKRQRNTKIPLIKNTSHKQNVLNMSHNIGVGLNAVYTQNDRDF